MAVVNPFVDRVLDVVALLAQAQYSMRLSEVSARLALSKSVTHRLLAALCARGWVEQEEGTGFYRLSLKLPALMHQHASRLRLADVAQPIVERIAVEAQEYARLAVVAGRELIFLLAGQGARTGLVVQGGAGRLPLHAAANGKAWLATLTDEEAAEIVLAKGFADPAGLGPAAVKTLAEFLDHLAATRRQGYAINVEESEPGIVTVAAAIQPGGPAAGAVGTVSITGPSVRFTPARAREVAATLVVPAARELGELWPLMGQSPPSAATFAKRGAPA